MIWAIAINVVISTIVFWCWWVFCEAQDRRYRNRMHRQYWERRNQ